MSYGDVLSWVQAPQFKPFRIRLNSGRTYDIKHPEMIKVGRASVLVFTYTGSVDGPHERVEMVSMRLMETIEAIETPQSA